MIKRWVGPAASLLVLASAAVVLFFNIEPNPRATRRKGEKTTSKTSSAEPDPTTKAAASQSSDALGREYPIGESMERNQIKFAAVWRASIPVEGMKGAAGSDVIHIEADVHAIENNPNGFALGEFIPYLEIHYKIEPVEGNGEPQQGLLMPMVASDGLHYGANVLMPLAGKYKLTYAIEPPSAGGLGRHTDSQSGVAPWWKPFEAVYDWDYPGPAGK